MTVGLDIIRVRPIKRGQEIRAFVKVVGRELGCRVRCFAVLTALIFLLVVTIEVSGVERTATKIGVSVAAITYSPVFLAHAAGFFNEEGLRVEITNIPGPAGQAALLSGELSALASDSFRLYRLAEQGDTRIIMIQKIIDALPLDVVVSKNWIQKTGGNIGSTLEARIRMLKGARIGTQSLGGAPQVMASFLVKKVGMDPQRDVQFVALNTVPATVIGLEKGQIDAFLLSVPNSLRAEVRGFGIVLVPYSDVPDFVGLPYNSLMVTAEVARKEPRLFRRITRAIGRARVLMSTDPKRAADLLREPLFQRVEPSLVLKSVESTRRAFPDIGRFDQGAIDRSVEVGIGAGYLKGRLNLKEGVHWTNEFFE
jgi:NitT/TauT family transport system substrate-binding protein